ncbi:MAG: DUF4388 domain-containing protein [Candidatus Dormibacteria bacterium]
MQNQGSIGPGTVAELLQTMQQDRATGTLSLESDGHQCALHFLFGHLFHAVSDREDGEAAVVTALDWAGGEYTFNPRAKLPPEETINSSTEDLVSRWQTGAKDLAAAPSGASSAFTAPVPAAALTSASQTPYPSFATGSGQGKDGDWPESAPGSESDFAEEEMPDIPPFQTPAPPPRPVQAAPPSPTLPARASAPGPSSPPAAPKPAPRPAPQPAPKPVAGATRSQLSVLVPMPGGPYLHSGLKASFLNFPMLLKTLSQDGFSGFVSVHGEGDDRSRGHILFREGSVIQAQQRSDGTYRRGKTALQEVTRTVALGHGLIDAVEIPADLAASVASLIVAATTFVNLPARIVDFEALLEYIGDQRVNGGVLVSQSDQVSVALLTEGTVKGSYSSSAPDLTDGPQVAAAACADREARIDVVAAPAPPLPALDLSELG